MTRKIAGLKRVAIVNVYPEIDHGQFAVKYIVNQTINIFADIIADGHDEIGAILIIKHNTERLWQKVPMQPLENDRWTSKFMLPKIGCYYFTLKAWIDHYQTWRLELLKKIHGKANIDSDLYMGLQLFAESKINKKIFKQFASLVKNKNINGIVSLLSNPQLHIIMQNKIQPCFISQYQRIVKIVVDRPKALFSSWYEIFPRSCAPKKNVHGTFKDLIGRLPYIKQLGFDVIYLPPIHPIGLTHRKGKNNTNIANANEPGSPWAIGNNDGGHMSIHPNLGSLQDFKALIIAANQLKIEIALDFTLQCSADHPYLKIHPEWFKISMDGSLQCAENPPKKYEDVYPFNFESPHYLSLWQECKKILLYWIGLGIRIFRVDNPHTKPFAFWEWLITEIKLRYPDTLFLAEAFTKPSVMYYLAKLGFTQSYTYFTWRNTKQELIDYFTEITSTPICHYFRANLWPNTPDILSEYLQNGGIKAFYIRVILAATLGSNYGIYGPAFEEGDNISLIPPSEDYLNSEKYEIRQWRFAVNNPLYIWIKKINTIRQKYTALHNMSSLKFHKMNNPNIIAYSKHNAEFTQSVLVIVNLDYKHNQSAYIDIDQKQRDLQANPLQLIELLTDSKCVWEKPKNYITLNPEKQTAYVFTGDFTPEQIVS